MNIIPFTRDSRRNRAAAYSRADGTFSMQTRPCCGSSQQPRHHLTEPGIAMGQVHCQPSSAKKHAAQLHLTLKINTLSQNRCRQLGPESSVAPTAWRKLLEQREHVGGHLGSARPGFQDLRSTLPRQRQGRHTRREEVVLQQEPSQGQKSRFLSQLCSSEQISLALGLRFL